LLLLLLLWVIIHMSPDIACFFPAYLLLLPF
jgi:hypothetical protein